MIKNGEEFDAIAELSKMIEASGLRVTFDPYRDATLGCSSACRGWDKNKEGWCTSHAGAIARGDYCAEHRDTANRECQSCKDIIERLRKRNTRD